MMNEGYSLSDIAAVSGNENGWGGNGGWWMIILFALIFGNRGFGGFGGGMGGNPVTEADLCNANSFNELKGAVGRLSDSQAAIARQTDNAICNLGYQNAQLINGVQMQMATNAAAAAQCCCDTQRAIDGVNYNAAMNTAAINQTTTEQTQKILDMLCQNKIDTLQAQVNQLEMQAAMSGVVRYPQTFAWNAGPSPFCGTPHQGCCNI